MSERDGSGEFNRASGHRFSDHRSNDQRLNDQRLNDQRMYGHRYDGQGPQGATYPGGAPYGADPLFYDDFGHSQQDEGFDFWGAVKTLLRWRWLIIGLVAAGGMAAIATILNAIPLYRAEATIEVRRQEAQIIEGSGVEPVSIADAEYMATQISLLKSRSLAERIAETLDLPKDPRYADQSLSRPERLKAATAKIRNNLSVAICRP